METDELFRLYVVEKKTLAEIAGPEGVTPAAIRGRLHRAGIPTRTPSEARVIAKSQTYSPEVLEKKRAVIAQNRMKIDAAARERWRQKMGGRTPPNKGKKMPEEQRLSMIELWSDPDRRRQQSERLRGEKSPHWKGGVKSELARRLDRSEWRRIRAAIYERDNWTCQDCLQKCLNTRDSKLYPKRKIQCHHIVSRRNGGSDEPDNLVTLCMSCHHKRERGENRGS